MIKVLMISGKKFAGKDETANFILRNTNELWHGYPYILVKKYGFADALKRTTAELLEFPYEWTQTQEGKEKFTHIKWEDMPHYGEICKSVNDYNMTVDHYDTQNLGWGKVEHPVYKYWKYTEGSYPEKTKLPGWKEYPVGPMKVREILQEFGTGIMRKIHGPIWRNKTLRQIKQERPYLAIINDWRFPDEDLEGDSELDVKKIRLTRNINDMSLPVNQHISETALDNYDKFHAYINNADMGIEETNKKVKDTLATFGWVV